MVQGNIQTHPTEGSRWASEECYWKFHLGGGLKSQDLHRKAMNQNWNSSGVGGEGVEPKKLMGQYGYFWKKHNLLKLWLGSQCFAGMVSNLPLLTLLQPLDVNK